MSKKFFLYCLAVILLVILSGCGTRQEGEYEWGNLRNLGSNINSPAKDEHPTFTGDGKRMFFASDREGTYDLYISEFVNGEWSRAELLPSPLNTERDEFDPFVTLDGKKLFFASNRDNQGEYWNCDIYLSEWNGEKWSRPKIYDSIFVTPDRPDWGVTLPRDFKTIIFSSDRDTSNPGTCQIYQSRWMGDRWSDPEKLPPPVNFGTWEATPYITPDGKTLYLNSVRDTSRKYVDIWKFEFRDGKWTNPQLMREPFLSDKHDYDPCLFPDGKKFYFTSNREGGLGSSDIYVVEKIFKRKD